ncbi:MAG TPA: Na/Pi cotransporter, partial [Aminobacterium sp.]|nr:Na/Pi cotransporter [Aminobacterium sp.]
YFAIAWVSSFNIFSDSKMVEEVNESEKILNELTHAIAKYAAEIWQEGLPSDLSTVLSSYVNGISDIERVGDHCQNLIELYEYKVEHRLDFSPVALSEFEDMFDTVFRSVTLSLESVAEEDINKAHEVIDVLEVEVDRKEKSLRKSHIRRLNRGECQPSAGVIFIDILSNLERIGDHAHNLSFIAIDIAKTHRH